MNHLKLNKYFIVLAIVTVTAGLLHGILQQLNYVAASTTFTVNSFIDAVDANPGDGVCATATNQCTLRAAIQESNALSGLDTINLPAGIYTLTLAGIDEDSSATGDLDLLDDVIINGTAVETTLIDGNALDRVFHNINATATLNNITVRNGDLTNSMAVDGGGGLFNEAGSLTLNDCRVVGNLAWKFDGFARGGGIYNTGTLLLTNTLVQDNEALGGDIGSGSGGGIYNENVAELNNSVINKNVSGAAGLLWSGDAGAIYNGASGTLTVTNSTIDSNETDGGNGGGILNGGGNVVVSGSTLSNNYIELLGLATGYGGGAIFNDNNGSVELVNSTVSHNRGGSSGGGALNASGIMTLTHVTVYSNTSYFGGGTWNTATLTIENSILAANISWDGGSPDCFGPLNSLGNNLLTTTDGCSLTGDLGGNIVGADPLLGPLQNNGGSTFTHAIPPESPATDSAASQGCPAIDQRGFSRPVDGDGDETAVCDIGAYEYLPLNNHAWLPLIFR